MNAEMHIENGKMVYGKRECSDCMGSGLKAARITCRTCNGSGNGKRGGLRQCKTCYGFGHEYDHVNRVTCPTCKGIDPMHAQDATEYDYMPKELWDAFEFRVVRRDQAQTWAAAYLAIGCVFSVTDYGKHKEMTDAELIDKVRTSAGVGVQACKVVDKDGTVSPYITILTSDNGYEVIGSKR